MSAASPFHSHRHAHLSSRRARQRRLLLRVVDAGLAGCVFGLPWLLGGRHPLGQLALVAMAATVALAWLLRQTLEREPTWRPSAGTPWVAAAVALVALQLLPLPGPLLAMASPKTSAILPLWSEGAGSAAGLGAWSCVSLAPAATLSGLALLGAYGLLFWVGLQRIEDVEDVERLLRWCGLSALAVAALGIAQYLGSNGRFLWFYEDPLCDTFDAAKAAFTNRDHFAHYLALGVGPFIWWVQDSLRKKHQRAERDSEETFASPGRDTGFRWLGFGALLAAGLLSWSRGGVVAILAAGVVIVAACRREKRIGRQTVLYLGGAALAMAVGIVILGGQQTASSRGVVAWSTALRAARDFPLVGAGVGSHRWVCPTYLDKTGPSGFDPRAGDDALAQADSGPLRIALETGMPGLTLLLAAVACVGFWCWRALRRAESRRARLAAAAAAAVLVASVLQGLVDSVWRVPSCMALVALLAACACRLSQMASPDVPARAARPLPRRRAALGAAAVGVLGAAMVFQQIGPVRGSFPWLAYQRLIRIPPDDEDPEQALTVAVLQKRVETLQEVVARDPTHAEAHVLLAGDCLKLFERIQEATPGARGLADVGRAAAALPTSSRVEVAAWLVQTVGPRAALLEKARQHARWGLSRCPLEGVGYAYFGQVGFLEGRGAAPGERACVEQALRVRPWDGNVLIAAGHEAIRSGDAARGVALWRRAYGAGHVHRCALVRHLAGRVHPNDPARDVAFFLDTFQPDLPILRRLDDVHAATARDEDLVRLRARRAEAARAAAASQTGSAAARLWLEAGTAHARLGDVPGALECLERAAACQPDDYEIRYQLAVALAERLRYAEAMEHVEWCLAKRPDDPAPRNVARQITQAQARRAWSGLPSEEPTPYRR
ncbi:MAG: O-antigen ligase family protein [Pirellulales bacterium]|nr:O-antigen ligase family protein [Pirellulales bacterium]